MISAINKWLGAPEVASEHGGLVDHMLGFVHWFMLVLFIGWSIYLCIVFYRFREKRQKQADYHGVRGHATTHIEIGVVIVEAVLLLGFAFPLWARQADEYPTSPDTVKLRAVGEKFLWNFQYAGSDKMLGAMNPRAINSATGNPTGKDPHDPNAKDDFISPSLKLPVDRPCIIDVRSKDVIHNLAIVPMRASQDATPGIHAHMWFKPVKTGSWDIICAQLCGPGHAQMKAVIDVVPQAEFDEWLKEQSANAARKSAEAAATPAAR